jgi:arylsulfatase A-like enzyme
MIECLDFHLDALLAELDAAGRLDDTVIVFLGDNGTEASVGDPNFPRFADGKGSPYESGLRVPLVVTEGRHLDATPYGTSYAGDPFVAGDLVRVGATVIDPVHVVDVYDTVLALAGLPQTGRDSISFAAQLAGPAVPARAMNFSERFLDMDEDGVVAGFVAVRSSRYKLVVWQEDDGTAIPCQSTLLFDLWTDRAEATDLSADPAYAAARDALRAVVDSSVTQYESGPTAPTHWFWRAIDGPRTTGACGGH